MNGIKNKTWLVTGASGRLGHQLCRWLIAHGCTAIGLRQSHGIGVSGVGEITLDLNDAAALREAMEDTRPDVIVHTAGLTDVDGCERDPEAAALCHGEATRVVAGAAAEADVRLIHISTDHLWDGSREMVTEDTPCRPVNAYARTKKEAEDAALATHPSALVLRTNFFGRGRPWRPSFSDWIESALRERRALRMFHDAWFTPIEMRLLCGVIAEMEDRGATGIYHAAGAERLSKYQFAIRLAQAFDLPADGIEAVSVADSELAAPRPHDMSLATEKIAQFLGHAMPDVAESLNSLRHDTA